MISRRVSSRAGSAPPRWWLPALARRHAPPPIDSASASAYPNQHVHDRLFREKQSTLGLPRLRLRLHFCSAAIVRGMDTAETESDPTAEKTREIQDMHYRTLIIRDSSHRDGAIYKKWFDWDMDYCVDMADRTETRMEPGCGGCYWTSDMLQIFSLKLAKSPVTVSDGSVQLYGYIAARDEYDLMLNYVFNCGRENPIVVREGDPIEMTGPKRGIPFCCDVLLEFDVRIKNGEKEEDDAQLIDGMVELRGLFMPWEPRRFRIDGDRGGAVDMSAALINDAVTAIVEVIVSKERSGFDLSLSSTISAVEAHEFQLFHGSVGDWCGKRRFAIAVTLDTMMHLKFVVGHRGSNGNIERNCSFKAKLNGYSSRQIKFELASILVKVTWAAWPDDILRF